MNKHPPTKNIYCCCIYSSEWSIIYVYLSQEEQLFFVAPSRNTGPIYCTYRILSRTNCINIVRAAIHGASIRHIPLQKPPGVFSFHIKRGSFSKYMTLAAFLLCCSQVTRLQSGSIPIKD